MLMWAYGSNLDIGQMKHRCPKAKKLSKFIVKEGAVVFRGCADVVVRRGSVIQGGLWSITTECEAVLDRYEGVANGYYMKKYFHLKDGRDVLFYQMRPNADSSPLGTVPPSDGYLDGIVRGYRDFDLDIRWLDMALQESWAEKDWTQGMRERHIRKGRPTLARQVPTSMRLRGQKKSGESVGR